MTGFAPAPSAAFVMFAAVAFEAAGAPASAAAASAFGAGTNEIRRMLIGREVIGL